MTSSSDSLLRQVMHPRLPRLDAVTGYLAKMDQQGRYTHRGPLVTAVEARHAERLNVDPNQVVGLSSGTAALTAAVATSDRDRWSVPSFTFAATGHAVLNAGAELVLHDVDPVTWQLPIQKPGAVHVLPFGAPVPRADFAGMIVDAASSLGQDELDLSALADDSVVMFSLNATKVMGCGEGGLAVCGSSQRAAAIRRWMHFGFGDYRIAHGPGANMNMPEMVAAYALAALDHWSEEREEWAKVRNIVSLASSDWPGLPHTQPIHPYWMIRTTDATHTALVEAALAARAIDSRRWWGAGLHRMPAFIPQGTHDFPVTDDLADTVLGLPLWRGMSDAHVDGVVEVLSTVTAATRHSIPGD